MNKIVAFHGNSCTGKTSSLYAVAKFLTEHGLKFRIQNMPYDNSGHVKNRQPFPSKHLEETDEARLFFIMDHIRDQCELIASGYDGFILSEMTVADLYYMYDWVCTINEVVPLSSVLQLCKTWLKQYDTIFVMKDSDVYIQDGSRYHGRLVKDALAPYYQESFLLDAKDESIFFVETDDPVQRTKQVVTEFKKRYLE